MGSFVSSFLVLIALPTRKYRNYNPMSKNNRGWMFLYIPCIFAPPPLNSFLPPLDAIVYWKAGKGYRFPTQLNVSYVYIFLASQ